jgi:hypothetical protein
MIKIPKNYSDMSCRTDIPSISEISITINKLSAYLHSTE